MDYYYSISAKLRCDGDVCDYYKRSEKSVECLWYYRNIWLDGLLDFNANGLWNRRILSSRGFRRRCTQSLFAKYKKLPITIFNVPGIVPLVPGGLAYQAVRNFVLGDYTEAIGFSVQVTVVAGAIAAGLMLSEVFNHSIRTFRERKERI